MAYICEHEFLAIIPDGPFSLAAAAAFGSGFGPNTGRPKPGRNEMRLAFVTDDMRHRGLLNLECLHPHPLLSAPDPLARIRIARRSG